MLFIRSAAVVLSSTILLNAATSLLADERPDRERIIQEARQLQEEAEQLERNGHGEEAEKLQRRAAEMMERAEDIARENSEQRESARRDQELRELQEQLERHHREVAEAADRLGPEHPEVAELRERAQHLAREIRERETPRGPRPEQREREIDEIHEHLRRMRQHHEELSQTFGPDHPERRELRQEIEQAERRLQELTAERSHHPEAEEIAGRIEHMHIAADNLRAAGLHDIAEHVMQRAAETERELHGRHEPRPQHDAPPHEPMHELLRQLEEIRHELGRLRNEVNELRERR